MQDSNLLLCEAKPTVPSNQLQIDGHNFPSIQLDSAHLVQQNSLATRILDLMQEAVCVVTSKLRVCYWNDAMTQFSGLVREQAVDKLLFDLLPKKFGISLSGEIHKAIATQSTLSGVFNQTFRENGDFVFRYTIAPFPAVDTEPLTVITFIDITDGQRLHRERERQEHLSTLGTLSVGVAQELTTPLDQICEHVDNVLALLGSHWSHSLDKQLNGIISQVYRISYLAHNLVALSQQTPPTFASLDINEIINEAVDMWGQTRNGHSSVSLQLAKALPTVVGDPILLSSAIQNLIRIAIEFAGDDAVPRICTKIAGDTRRIHVIIEDRGPGLTPEEAEHLFEFFYGGSSISPGSVLGLFITKKVIEAQRGTFTLTSQQGRGTVFTISLPILSFHRNGNGKTQKSPTECEQ